MSASVAQASEATPQLPLSISPAPQNNESTLNSAGSLQNRSVSSRLVGCLKTVGQKIAGFFRMIFDAIANLFCRSKKTESLSETHTTVPQQQPTSASAVATQTLLPSSAPAPLNIGMLPNPDNAVLNSVMASMSFRQDLKAVTALVTELKSSFNEIEQVIKQSKEVVPQAYPPGGSIPNPKLTSSTMDLANCLGKLLASHQKVMPKYLELHAAFKKLGTFDRWPHNAEMEDLSNTIKKGLEMYDALLWELNRHTTPGGAHFHQLGHERALLRKIGQ